MKDAFPNNVPVKRPEFSFKGITDPFWVAGFTSGDGSFHIILRDFNTNKGSVSLRFSIKLNIREIEIIKGLVTFFKLRAAAANIIADLPALAGANSSAKNFHTSENFVALQVTKISDIVNTIIPFFEKYPIVGVKSLDFADFKKVAFIIQSKEHLTPEGLNQIFEIKSNMNQNRLVE